MFGDVINAMFSSSDTSPGMFSFRPSSGLEAMPRKAMPQPDVSKNLTGASSLPLPEIIHTDDAYFPFDQLLDFSKGGPVRPKGKSRKEIREMAHLLMAHGDDQSGVYKRMKAKRLLQWFYFSPSALMKARAMTRTLYLLRLTSEKKKQRTKERARRRANMRRWVKRQPQRVARA